MNNELRIYDNEVVNITNNNNLESLQTIESCNLMLEKINNMIKELENKGVKNIEIEDAEGLQIKGVTNFMGIEIPVIEGGFGEGKKAITDKHIAEIHNMKARHVRENINKNIKRFKEGVDYIDLKRVGEVDTLIELGYAKQSITQAEHIYLLSERGYAKLIKIMDTDLAWEIHDKLIDEYFQMKEIIKHNNIPSYQIEDDEARAYAWLREKRENKYKQLITLKRAIEERKEKLIVLENTLTFDQFNRVANAMVNEIAKLSPRTNSEVWNDIYAFLRRKFGMCLNTRQQNEWERIQEESLEKRGRYYADSTLKQKCSKLSCVREHEYQQVIEVIKAYAIEKCVSVKRLEEILRLR